MKNKKGFILDVSKDGNVGFGYGETKPPKLLQTNIKGFVSCPYELTRQARIKLAGWYDGEPLYTLIIDEIGNGCEPLPLDFIIKEIKNILPKKSNERNVK